MTKSLWKGWKNNACSFISLDLFRIHYISILQRLCAICQELTFETLGSIATHGATNRDRRFSVAVPFSLFFFFPPRDTKIKGGRFRWSSITDGTVGVGYHRVTSLFSTARVKICQNIWTRDFEIARDRCVYTLKNREIGTQSWSGDQRARSTFARFPTHFTHFTTLAIRTYDLR